MAAILRYQQQTFTYNELASNQAQRKIGPGRDCMRMRQNSQKTCEFVR